jgi:PadR family transcriptional regulator
LLAVLVHGPQHGYAAIAALREQTDGQLDLPEGTVYPALHRLERAGLLASSWEPGVTRRRRVYALTPAGHRALRAERREWSRFATAVHTVLQPGVAT